MRALATILLCCGLLSCGGDDDQVKRRSLESTGGSSGGDGGEGGGGGATIGGPCADDLQLCQLCVAQAAASCRASLCEDPVLALLSCASENGCADEGGELDPACAGQACRAETAATLQCFATCAPLRACAGM